MQTAPPRIEPATFWLSQYCDLNGLDVKYQCIQQLDKDDIHLSVGIKWAWNKR